MTTVERRVEARPRWPLRLPASSAPDGVLQVRGGVLHRLLHVDGEPVVVRAAQPAPERVVIGARAARADLADEGIARMRFALGVDDDLRPFHERFRFDPLIGRLLRANRALRPRRRPEPFEALAWAVTEQLIDFPRAAGIQRRLVHRFGARCAQTGLREPPTAAAIAACSPPELQACDLSAGRSVSLWRAARAIVAGRIDLRDADHARTWRGLRAIPGIGPWTVEVLALTGQGRYDQGPAGDLGLLKLVGRLRSGSPHVRAQEDEVRELLARYEPWAGLAAVYLLAARPDRFPAGALRSPGRAGTRWSAPARRRAAA